jgi:hypothetical protein
MLERMRDFCEPVILLAWQDPELESELRSIAEVHPLMKAKWGGEYEKARGVLNNWFFQELGSPSTPIRERRANLDRSLSVRLRRNLRQVLRELVPYVPGGLNATREKEARLFRSGTNSRDVFRQIRSLRAVGVFCLTPFIQDEEMTVRVCSEERMPCSTAIISFDNLTTRNWIPITFDSYMLWNRHNAEQLRRGYPESQASDVSIVGSPQFDFYSDRRYIWDESMWRRSVGLTGDRPVILFGGGYYTCAPHEPRFLAQLDQAISNREIPGDPIVLFRRHPVDPIGRWEQILKDAKNVVHDDPWQLGAKTLGHTNISHEDIAKLASTLYHTVAHVNVASTMSIDGAILDRPQVGPAYDDSPGRKYHRAALECYQQEHFLPIFESGGISIARSRDQLIASVGSAILSPADRQAGRQRIVREICTYNDGKATERVLAAVHSFVTGRFVTGTNSRVQSKVQRTA